MSSVAKKFLYILVVLVATAGLLLVNQIKRAVGISTQSATLPLISPVATPLPSSSTDPLLGNPGAPLTATVFLSLGDGASQALYAKVSGFVKQHPTDARLVWKDYPKSSLFFGNSNLAHQATYCAGTQKKFWLFVDALYTGVGSTREAGLRKIAKQIGLSEDAWWQCTNAPSTVAIINDAVTLAHNIHLDSAPALFINNKRINFTNDVDLPQMLTSFIQK